MMCIQIICSFEKHLSHLYVDVCIAFYYLDFFLDSSYVKREWFSWTWQVQIYILTRSVIFIQI